MTFRVDAHHHLWKVARGDYGWLSGFPSIARDFSIDDMRPLLRDARIDKTILMQAAESIAETHFLLDIAERETFVGGVVGWVDFEQPDAIEQIAGLARWPKLAGLRPMLQDMPDTQWILRKDFTPILQAMQQHRLRFDALIRPRHLPVFVEFAQRHPQLQLVIDHAAKPDIRNGGLAKWAAGIRPFASIPHVHCKLSGLATEAAPDWNVATLKPYVEVLLEVFGPQRLMWGSDWPVLLLAGDYARWLDTAHELTAHLDEKQRTQIFGATAATFYGIAHD